MRVLLVHPARNASIDRLVRLPPLGLACIAGSLRSAEHEVRILDAAVLPSWKKVMNQTLSTWSPQVVGITASTEVFGHALALADMVKKYDPGITIILGGVHATLFPRDILCDGLVDYGVYGEGEQTIVALLAALAGGKGVENITGVSYRVNGLVHVNPPRAPIEHLDALPFPAYDLLPMAEYSTPFSKEGRVISMVTSRGCPHSCTFCDARVVHGSMYRALSAQRIVKEIRHLHQKFGIREVLFKDSEFTLDRDRIDRFCDLMIAENLKVTWTCSARVNSVSEPLLCKMAMAGCRVIQFGVESGDLRVLRALKKGISHDQVRRAFQATRVLGIETVANLMVGLPMETWDSIRATWNLIQEIEPTHLNIQSLVIYPGTDLFSTTQGQPVIDPAEALRRRRYLLRSFYFRPKKIIDRVWTLNPRRWQENLAAARQMLGLSP